MKPRIRIHLASIGFVTVVALMLLLSTRGRTTVAGHGSAAVSAMPDLSFINFTDPFEKSLALDVMNIYFPGNFDKNSAVIATAAEAREKAFRDKLQNNNEKQRLSWAWFGPLLGMYLKFVAIYGIVMLLTYYGVQTMGVWRFCREKNAAAIDRPKEPALMKTAKTAAITIGSFILFCPAYVIAYSMRTELNTDTAPFMVLLCVLSNGLLIVYANKFYAFLSAESRKGYVDTAIVKNLHNAYGSKDPGGISLKAVCSPLKRFDGHVFDHIFRNARFQYLATIKEQASFLITGMIITEMALNLHGYLSYEMLRQMLYGNMDIVIVMLLLIFYTVKGTDIFADFLINKETRKYETK